MATYDLSIDTQICDHMAWELNQSGFQETLVAKAETDVTSMSGPYGTVTRTYLPEYDHDMPNEYRISIYPQATVQIRNSRSRFRENYDIVMVLFKKLDVGTQREDVTAEGDKTMLLADELRKWFENEGPDGAKIQDGAEICECARWLGVNRPNMFGMAEMNDLHVLYVPMLHRWMTIRRLANCGT